MSKFLLVGLSMAMTLSSLIMAQSQGNSLGNGNGMNSNYSNEYQDTQGWYDAGGQMIYNTPQPPQDTPNTNNSIDSVPINLPGTSQE